MMPENRKLLPIKVFECLREYLNVYTTYCTGLNKAYLLYILLDTEHTLHISVRIVESSRTCYFPDHDHKLYEFFRFVCTPSHITQNLDNTIKFKKNFNISKKSNQILQANDTQQTQIDIYSMFNADVCNI